MAIVVDRKEVDALTGWPKVKALRALTDDFEARAVHAPGSSRGDFLYAAHELTDEANKLSTVLSGVKMVATPSTQPRTSRRGSWLLAPIRFLRCQFRRLEAATRPE